MWRRDPGGHRWAGADPDWPGSVQHGAVRMGCGKGSAEGPRDLEAGGGGLQEKRGHYELGLNHAA